MEFEIVYWHWLVLGMLLIAVEIVLPSFTALWFGAGAILVGLLMLIIPIGPVTQIFVWTISSAIFTWAWFKYLKPKSIDKTKAGLSREAIMGQIGHVIEIPNSDRRGTLRFTTPILGSDEWHFISAEEEVDGPISAGDRVRVTDVSGNTLIVRKAN